MDGKSVVVYSANSAAMSWQDVVAILIRRRRLISRITLCGAALFAAIALLRPPTYTAAAKLLVSPRITDTPISPEPNAATNAARGIDYQRIEAEINDTVTMLTSPVLIEAALRKGREQFPAEEETGLTAQIKDVVHAVLKLPSSCYRWVHGIAEVPENDAAVGEILDKLSVKPVEKSQLIDISFTNDDPNWSAGLVNALIKTYMDPTSRPRDETASLEFFQAQRAVLEGKLDEAQTELRRFREQDAGDLAFADEQELRSVRLELQTSKETAEAELSEVTAQVAALQIEAARLPKSLGVTAQVEQTGPVASLKSRILDLELEKNVVASKYAPGSQAMVDVERRLATARQLLDQEMRHTASSISATGAGMESLTMALVNARTREAQLTARVNALNAQIADYTSKLDRLDIVSRQHQKLLTHVEAARAAYQTYLQKEEDARFATAVEDTSLMNVVVASPASVPLLPDPSGMLSIFLLGTVLSFGAGAGLALLRDRLDPSVKTMSEAEQVAGLPVISLMWTQPESGEDAVWYQGPAGDTRAAGGED